MVDEPPEVPDGAGVTRTDLRDRVVGLADAGVDRRGEADPGLDGEAQGVVAQAREVGEHLDELVAGLFSGAEQPQEVGVQLRLAADELQPVAAERVGLPHDRLVRRGGEHVAVPAERMRLGVAVNALQVAAVGQLEPQEVESPVHGVPLGPGGLVIESGQAVELRHQ